MTTSPSKTPTNIVKNELCCQDDNNNSNKIGTNWDDKPESCSTIRLIKFKPWKS